MDNKEKIAELLTKTGMDTKPLVIRSLPSAEQIDAAIKELGKQSTAPDKETPDWLEADIRRGMLWMLNRVVGNAV
jgi:hypothetical protein